MEEQCGICGKTVDVDQMVFDVECGMCCKEHYDPEELPQ